MTTWTHQHRRSGLPVRVTTTDATGWVLVEQTWTYRIELWETARIATDYAPCGPLTHEQTPTRTTTPPHPRRPL